ncbi:MAG TPA: cell division protein FtsA [Kiritimatiellia bacterium]|nr:cell division protein FtsA [Kiritimatiellia bacterium]
MSDFPPIVAVEIGTSKVRALVAEIDADDQLALIGIGECASIGVRKAEITNFDAVVGCVRLALDNAEESANVVIKELYMLMSGGHVQSVVNRGTIPILWDDHEIIEEDLEQVGVIARNVNLPAERQVLHSITQHYYVDDQPGIIDPVGMEGYKLSVDMLVVHGLMGRMRNFVRAAKQASVEVVDVAFGGLCAALAVLTPEDKANGCLVIDLGAGTTDFVVYADGIIALADSIGVGGDHVTNDIARGLRLSTLAAERIKEQHASATINLAQRGQRLSLPAESGVTAKSAKVGDLHVITHARMEELFELIRMRIARGKFAHVLGAGVVLTGGGASMAKVADLAEQVFGLPCRIGTPRNISGFASTINSPEYAAPVGLLNYAQRSLRRDRSPGGMLDWFKRVLGGR